MPSWREMLPLKEGEKASPLAHLGRERSSSISSFGTNFKVGGSMTLLLSKEKEKRRRNVLSRGGMMSFSLPRRCVIGKGSYFDREWKGGGKGSYLLS